MTRPVVIRGAAAVLALALGTAYPAGAATPDWPDLIKAGQQEGKVELILSGQVPQKLKAIMPEFEKKYGVKVNFQTGSGNAHAKRILAERQLGRFTVDAWIGGANTALLQLVPNNALAPIDTMLKDPNVTDQSLWFQGKHHYSDPESKYIFTWGASPEKLVAYNTKMVDPNEIKSYADLLDPKWKGKIVSWSPASQGTAASATPLLMNPKIGPEWFKRWATEMDVTIVADARQGAEWVAIGRFPIGMFGLQTQARELQEQGFPITDTLPHAMAEGSVLSSSAANIMVLDRSPNPNATALFVNWALSTEGQTLFIKTGERGDTLRNDVPSADLIDAQYRIDRTAEYFIPFESQEYMTRQEEFAAMLRKIMADAGHK